MTARRIFLALALSLALPAIAQDTIKIGLVTALSGQSAASGEAIGTLALFEGKGNPSPQAIKLDASGGSLNGVKKPVADGAINPHKAGGYMLIYDKPMSDFVLSLDFKITLKCNSGVFIRTEPLTPRPGKDVGFNGIEVAIDDTAAGYLLVAGSDDGLVRVISFGRDGAGGRWTFARWERMNDAVTTVALGPHPPFGAPSTAERTK